MPIPFMNRVAAGRELAGHLRQFARRPDVLVLGLPRGGVPVAAEVAYALGAQLDVFVVRKLGAPGREELAIGAVASGNVRVVNPDLLGPLGVSRTDLDRLAAREQRELERRERLYRGGRPFPALANRTVILVDDGVATGATMLAAVRALRQLKPVGLVVAAPVMSTSAYWTLAQEADACVTLATPEPFDAVGAWYEDFRQTTDEEVLALLGIDHSIPPEGEPVDAAHH